MKRGKEEKEVFLLNSTVEIIGFGIKQLVLTSLSVGLRKMSTGGRKRIGGRRCFF